MMIPLHSPNGHNHGSLNQTAIGGRELEKCVIKGEYTEQYLCEHTVY